MIINNKRALVYPAMIEEVREIPGCDNIHSVRVNGWWIIAKKSECQLGDKVLYFEIDSLVPASDARFAFMEKCKYRVKTMKMRGVYSQGLVMPISIFPEVENAEINTDLTEKLGVCYYVAEDNQRKADVNPYFSMQMRHKKLFKKWPFSILMRYDWGRKLLFAFFGKKKDKAKAFPTKFAFIHKTDETRVENMPYILESDESWVKTEKIDGTSATYIVEKKPFGRHEFYVCSRNVRMLTPNQENYHTGAIDTENVYWEMAKQHNIEQVLLTYMKRHNLDYVCLQGEIAGPGLQKNRQKLDKIDFYGFNLIRSDNGRMSSIEGKREMEEFGINWVPIIDAEYVLPRDMEEFKLTADGKSVLNPTAAREGFVYRSQDGQLSFKNVSREYLLKMKE